MSYENRTAIYLKYTISIDNGIICAYAVWSLTLIRLAEIVCWFELHWKWCVSYTCRWAPAGDYIPSLSFRNLSFQVWWTIKTIKKGTPQKVLCQFKSKIMATLIAIEMCHNIDNQAWGSRHTNIKFLQAPLSTYRSMISFGFPLNPCSHPIFLSSSIIHLNLWYNKQPLHFLNCTSSRPGVFRWIGKP